MTQRPANLSPRELKATLRWNRGQTSGISSSRVFQTNRSIEELDRQLIVRVGKRFVRAFSNFFQDLHVLTPCPIPPAGGGILVCNHTSSLDPILLQATTSRLITWMMAKEYGYQFGLMWFFRAIEPILVERSGRDLAATREALRALENGKLLGIFPEGKLETSLELLEFQTGVALLAMKSGAPVYPAFIDGTQRGKGVLEVFLSPNRCSIAFGPPLVFERSADRADLEAATARIRNAVAELSRFTR